MTEVIFENTKLELKENENYLFIFDRDKNIKLYFALKEKHNCEISTKSRNDFIKSVALKIDLLSEEFDTIVIPESSKTLLEDIVNITSFKQKKILIKNKPCYIKTKLFDMKLSKSEFSSQIKRIDKMADSFYIHYIKSNKRKIYIPYLFKEIETNRKVLFLDDSIFTGNTLEAAKYAINKIDKVISIFG